MNVNNWYELNSININIVVTKQKVTEWKITKTGVGNEMEIFTTLNKCNTRQQREEYAHW